MEIADGVDGSGKVDYRYEWQQINSFTINFKEGTSYEEDDEGGFDATDLDGYSKLRSRKTAWYAGGEYNSPEPVVIDALPNPDLAKYRLTQRGMIWSVIEDNPETFDPPRVSFDRSTGQGESINCIHHCTIRQYNVERIEDTTNFDSTNYILDNLVVADVGTLSSLTIPAVDGVDAHNCGIGTKTNGKILIGGRDYLNDIQADWGTTTHLCLYGNNISFSEFVCIFNSEFLANGDYALSNESYRGRAFSYKAGCGPFDVDSGVWNSLPENFIVWDGMKLWVDGGLFADTYNQHVSFYTDGFVGKPNYLHVVGARMVTSSGQTQKANTSFGPSVVVWKADIRTGGWGKDAESSAGTRTKGQLRSKWSGYADGKKAYVLNWICDKTNGAKGYLTVWPFGSAP